MAAAPVAKRAAARAAGKVAATGTKAKTGSKLERDRAAIQAIKDARPAETPADQPAEAPAPTSPGAGASAPSLFSDVRPSGAGGGLVLGALIYVVGLTYLRSGGAGVKALLKAKFFNEVS